MEYNIYCDESCHLPNDSSNTMVLGGIWCLKEKKKEIFKRLKEIKVKHGLSENFEVKWNKVSPAKQDFYINLIDYFFDDDDVHFRAIVVNKEILDHKKFNQTHDDFYYKMYFGSLVFHEPVQFIIVKEVSLYFLKFVFTTWPSTPARSIKTPTLAMSSRFPVHAKGKLNISTETQC